MITFSQIMDMLVGRTQADTYLSDVFVIRQDKANIEVEIQTSLATLNPGGDKKPGAAIVWMMPEAMDTQPNVSNAPMTLSLECLVLEDPTINRDTAGTGLAADEIARRLRDLFKHFTIAGHLHPIRCAKQFIQSGTSELAPVVLTLKFEAEEASVESFSRVATPVIVVAADEITSITCATAGAAIYYTTDGSYPSNANPNALPWEGGPVESNDGTVILAAAEKTNFLPSSIARATVG